MALDGRHTGKVTGRVFECPICDVEIEIGENELKSKEIMCTYCECPLRIRTDKEGGITLTEDF